MSKSEVVHQYPNWLTNIYWPPAKLNCNHAVKCGNSTLSLTVNFRAIEVKMNVFFFIMRWVRAGFPVFRNPVVINIAAAIRRSQYTWWEGAGSVVILIFLGLAASVDAEAHSGDCRHQILPLQCRAPVRFSCSYPCFTAQIYKYGNRNRGVSKWTENGVLLLTYRYVSVSLGSLFT